MAGPFTLAALAASAAPGFVATSVRPVPAGFRHAAVLVDERGDAALVRVAASAAEGERLRAEARALAAFSGGVRARLPFAVPTLLGIAEPRPVLVTAWVPGSPLRPAAVRPGAPLAAALGRAVAALHALPTGIAEGSLRVRTPAIANRDARDLVDALGDRLPAAVAARWREALDHAPMWRYRPVVVHGALAPEELLTDRDEVTGVLGWAALHVGDPAADLAWALSLPVRGAADAVFVAHADRATPDAQLRQRATLLAELELAKWQAHAERTGDAALVADAQALLRALEARVTAPGAAPLVGEPTAVLSLHEVERLLASHEGGVARIAADQRASSSASDSVESGRITRSAAT